MSRSRVKALFGVLGLGLCYAVSTTAQDLDPCPEREREFQKAIKLDWKHAETICLSNELYESCKPQVLGCLRELRDMAQKKKLFDKVVYFGAQITELPDSNAHDFFRLGIAYVEQGKIELALKALEKAEADDTMWAEARYHRLLLLEDDKALDGTMKRKLWTELLEKKPKEQDFRLGFVLHLIHEEKIRDAWLNIRTLKPQPDHLTERDSNHLDEFFLVMMDKVPENDLAGPMKRWIAWVPSSRLRPLFLSERALKKRNWYDAHKKTSQFLKTLEGGGKDLIPYAPRANLLHGIALSQIGQHKKAALAFDLCSEQDILSCKGWLARELAYLGRWDLAWAHWSTQLSVEKLPPRDRQSIQKLLVIAEKHGARSQREQALPPPSWMRTKLP